MAGQKVDITPDQDGGILKEVKREGIPDCKPWKGDRVSVHYVGTLESDGSQFDSSRERGAKFNFNLGKGEVIKGWDLGVATMNKNELAVFTIKSEYGYGDMGSPPKIPGGATLVFEVELFEFEGEDITKKKDKGVTKRTLEMGEGLDHPNEGSLVEVDLKGECGGKVFDQREAFSFTLGEGLEHGLPPGFELAVEKMKKQEVARVTLKGDAYVLGAKVPAGTAPNATLDYDIKVRGFERAKESWQLDGEQKLEQARLFKEKGTIFFKDSKYELASKKYKKIIEFLEHEISLKGEQEEERKAVLQAGRLNLAMCYLKTGEWIETRNVCDKVLEESAECEKAYFRRGEAFLHLNDHELAKQDFSKVLELDPSNKAAKNKVAICLQEMKKQKAKEKKTFANMFDRFAQIDAKREEEAKKNQKPVEISEWGHGKDNKGSSDVLKVSGDIEMDLDLSKEMTRAEEERMAEEA